MIVAYESSNTNQIPIAWVNNITDKCGVDYVSDAFQSRSLTKFGSTAFALGAFIGVVIQYMHSPRLLSSGPKNDTVWKMIGRFAMAFAVSTPWIVLVMVLRNSTSPSPYVRLFIQSIFPNFLIGFSFYYVADMVNVKIGLLQTSETMGDEPENEKGDGDKDMDEDNESSSLLRDEDKVSV